MPSGYHSLTKPGSAQLEVPTRMRPATVRTLATAAPEAVGGRRHGAQIGLGRVVVRPDPSWLDVSHLRLRQVRALQPRDAVGHDVDRPVAALQAPLGHDE